MPEPQRIVILNNQGLRAIGGGPTIMRALVRRLRPRHQVAVLSYDAPAPDAGVEQVQLASPPTAGSVVWRVQALLRAWFLRRTVPARFGPPADLLIVLDPHFAYAVPRLPANRRVYVALTCAARQEWFNRPGGDPWRARQYALLERAMVRRADLTVVASGPQRDDMRRHEGLPDFAPLVLPPVFPAMAGTDAAAPAVPAGGPVTILAAARLVPLKRIELVLELARRLRGQGCRFRVLGDGPEAARLRQAAVDMGVGDMVEFRGATVGLDGSFAAADIFLHTSVYESFGMAIFEAMLHGLPVLCGTGCGIVEHIADGTEGRVVDFADLDRAAMALAELVRDPARRRAMGQAAAAKARALLRQDYVGDLCRAAHVPLD